MRSSDWIYLGYVLVGVGGALALSGLIAFYYSQQGRLLSTRYGSYFVPILLLGVLIAALGIIAFVRANQNKKKAPPPPPFPPPPPPPFQSP